MQRTLYLYREAIDLYTYVFKVAFTAQMNIMSNSNTNSNYNYGINYEWIEDANRSSDYMEEMYSFDTLSSENADMIAYWVLNESVGDSFPADLHQTYFDKETTF